MKALVIAVYLGPLPDLMPLWLRSAGHNRDVDFLVVSDRAAPADLPANVRFEHSTLAQLAALWSTAAGFEVALTSPYKLNDFKPLYWMLAQGLDRYDYWGFCDLDVIFGDLSPLVDGRLGRYDMVCSEGHLRFLRNDASTRDAWREVTAPLAWTDVFADPYNRGLDEHHGINRVFRSPGRSWFTDPGLIADIDPSFRQMRRMARYPNHRIQAFYWEGGKVWREYWDGTRYGRDEYHYIHLQKRHQSVDPACVHAPSFDIDPDAIRPRTAASASRKRMVERNPWHLPSPAEARILLRETVREWRGIPHVISAVDKPATAAQ